MWKDMLDLFRQAFTVTESLSQTKADLKELRQEVRELTSKVTGLHYEVQRLKDYLIHEREKQALRGEIEQLRSRLGLPPAPPDKKPDE